MTTQTHPGFFSRLIGRRKKWQWAAVLTPDIPADIPETQRLAMISCKPPCIAVYIAYLREPLPSGSSSWVDRVYMDIQERITRDCPHHSKRIEGES